LQRIYEVKGENGIDLFFRNGTIGVYFPVVRSVQPFSNNIVKKSAVDLKIMDYYAINYRLTNKE
jgi:hypothetical protein